MCNFTGLNEFHYRKQWEALRNKHICKTRQRLCTKKIMSNNVQFLLKVSHRYIVITKRNLFTKFLTWLVVRTSKPSTKTLLIVFKSVHTREQPLQFLRIRPERCPSAYPSTEKGDNNTFDPGTCARSNMVAADSLESHLLECCSLTTSHSCFTAFVDFFVGFSLFFSSLSAPFSSSLLLPPLSLPLLASFSSSSLIPV